MKKNISSISIILLLIVFIVSCKKEPVAGVNLDKFSMLIGVGKTDTLTATIVPSYAHNQKVEWESSDPNIAIVSNGVVTGKSAGNVMIVVVTEDGKRTAKCYVEVLQPIESEMVWVEGGTFIMGCQDDECIDNELPIHQVTLTGFYIAKYETTQKEWIAIMGNNPSYHKGDLFPVEYASYDDMQKFIQRLNTVTEKNYRLPTEAEWEFAARGGIKSKGFKYSGSNNIEDVTLLKEYTYPVGTKAPNELGIYDMSGNVYERCSDWYAPYTDTPQTNPQGPENGTDRVIRGGSYYGIDTGTYKCRVAYRHLTTLPAAFNMGLRLVHP